MLEADADESAARNIGKEEGGVTIGHTEVNGLTAFSGIIEHDRKGGALEMEVGRMRECESVKETRDDIGACGRATKISAGLEAGHRSLHLGNRQPHALGDLREGERLALADDPFQKIETTFQSRNRNYFFTHDIFYCH